MKRFFFLLLAICTLLVACEQSHKTPQIESLPALKEPTSANLAELPPEALSVWRKYAELKPALLLYAFDPMLFPPAPDLSEQANRLATAGTTEQLRKVGSYYRTNPQLLPPQTLRVAIDAGLISKLYWVYPKASEIEDISLDAFRDHMAKTGAFSEAELATVTLENGVIRGNVRGIPFAFIHPDAMATLDEPLLLHIDLSYFERSYKNEIKTPIYDLLHATLGSIRDNVPQLVDVSISMSNEEGIVSNDFRFLGKTLVDVFADPGLLDREMPELWKLRKEALYKSAFFQNRAPLDAYKQMVEKAPQDAAVHYDLYRGNVTLGNQQEALKALDRAIELDPGYAFTLINLVTKANNAGRTDVALELLERAQKAFPDNPMIRIEIADILQKLGRFEEADKLLTELNQIDWSPAYHQYVPASLEQIAAASKDARELKK